MSGIKGKKTELLCNDTATYGSLNVWEITLNVWEISLNVWEISLNVWEICER